MSDTYTAILALPHGDMALDAAARLFADNVTVIDNEKAGIWLSWSVDAESDTEGISELQLIRVRAEMRPEFVEANATTANGDLPSLFQNTPFVIMRGGCVPIYSEEVVCI